ncbi:hypothetical protein [Sandaracinus amylolyticus]|uniref:23S rRNA (Adenine(2030)-N(6))-methyltransferase RlmJ n=1 Tax=Sandaracinus amylolyticus TaxID=927083 RepID=A0A0F6SDZ3_9BACT|nr:hypothetical protein [Sandaracinus amylolyticus]AKF04294.1 hypothetical protein DB32_001443 [Sandaracinus amylolyticus]
MARPTNRQSRSVGNLGDVLKHAALIALAERLAHTRVRYVDTHTFLLHAPLADLERWNADVERLVSEHPAYARYIAAERASLARTSHYRCSSGLVLDVLGHQRSTLVLGEANVVTRAELKEQIREERLVGVHVVDEAVAALEYRWRDTGPLLVHIDPFALSPELWRSLAPALDALCESSTDVAIVVYRYTRNARSPWPVAPRGTHGPVAQTRGGPHELAAYASPRMTSAVQEACASLGWRIEH